MSTHFCNGLVLEHGELHGKKVAAVQYGDGCLSTASTAFEVGCVVRSVIVPLANGKHEHDIVGRVSSGNKPATLRNQEMDHAKRVAIATRSSVSEFEYELTPQDRKTVEAALHEQEDDPVNTGRPTNPFEPSFSYSERPTPQAGRKMKPSSPFDDPRGSDGNLPGKW